MDGMITFGVLGQLLQAYGPFGIIVVVWYFDIRAMRKQNEQYVKDMADVMNKHEKYMEEIRVMYKNNVKLVEGYESLAGDLKSIIVMNTEVITTQTEAIKQNQFCPSQRVEKKNIQVEG
ncbi:MAG: hypothetical protein JRD05_00650 [Deltaproteobacteria bacterium]|nr:hypothetical protein [Deltaproteobacteria bacterium]